MPPFASLFDQPALAKEPPAGDLTSHGVVDLARMIEAGDTTAREAVDACLERTAAVGGRDGLNAYITLADEAARAEADHLDSDLAAGRVRGPLHGVPVCVKDVIDVAGMRTTGGTAFVERHEPVHDAHTVALLRAAGAIVLGKTNLHEASFGTTSVNPHYGPVRNPFNQGRVAGGSSGGSAAAVAGRLCPGGLGGDTGGSIRIPSSLCGLVGFKPTAGRTSGEGILHVSWSLDVVGTLTRSVADAALLLSVISDAGDVPIAAGPLPGSPSSALAGLRIGALDGYFADDNDPAVDAAIANTRETLARHGADVVPMSVPEAELGVPTGLTIIVPEAIVAMESYWREADPKFSAERILAKLGEDVRGVIASERGPDAQPIPATAYLEALRSTRAQVCAGFHRALADVDLLLAPTLPLAAMPLEEAQETTLNGRPVVTFEALVRYTFAVSVAGLPAVTIPGGQSADGMPVGVQLIGRQWDEATLLRAAHGLELATS